MFTELIMVSVTPYSGTLDPDKNGNFPVMLQCIAGRMPNRNVLSGTVAQRQGYEIGKTYLVLCREQGFDKVFGPDFQFVKVKELTEGVDIAKTIKELGPPILLTIERPEGFEKVYERKTNAVEGQRTVRIKQGNYIPVQQRNYAHETAPEVLEGTSTQVNPEQNPSAEELDEAMRGKGGKNVIR